ncbi:hypothetical protein QN239_32315 [Mycolicibacterium sp. Y3]
MRSHKFQRLAALAGSACVLLAAGCADPHGTVVRDPDEGKKILIDSDLALIPADTDIIYFRQADYVVGSPDIRAVFTVKDFTDEKYLTELRQKYGPEQFDAANISACQRTAEQDLNEFAQIGFNILGAKAYCSPKNIEISLKPLGDRLMVFVAKRGH